MAAGICAWALAGSVNAREWHVAVNGDDAHPGTVEQPLRTIQRAADLAQPGDIITVHRGVYRERINPPRGGDSDDRRITYQAAPGEEVTIKGSEEIKGWTKVQDDTWKVVLPNTFFGDFNPYHDLIRGDWFDPRGREHHTGAVYLNGDWLTEATRLEEVLAPVDDLPEWYHEGSPGTLLNIAWFRPVSPDGSGERISATRFAAMHGIQTAPASEGGECLGWIEPGDWIRYDDVHFADGTTRMEFRVASESAGGLIDIRLDSPRGERLGSCPVAHTGGWQSWKTVEATIRPVSGRRTVCLTFSGHPDPIRLAALNPQRWFARVDDQNTTIWAQFRGVNPNEQTVEINVRRTVFYPDRPGRNYITVRGFNLCHAATPWAPPTAEQIGLIGTHWSRGWIIENNRIHHSVCSGIALGKYGDQWDNTSQNTAEGYVQTIERALASGWTMENIGHHVVRDNVVSHCEQAGIVGSLGPIGCLVTGNVIHDIHIRRLFTGAEMAGIKFHAAIDTEISRNRIYRTCQGLWLDWMAQGTRVTANLFHDNLWHDLFVEVNHGPFLIDNNLFLSPVSLLNMSQGGAWAHNLFAGRVITVPEPSRQTPFLRPHSTAVAGLENIAGGDDRFYNNIFAGGDGLAGYDTAARPVFMGGNVFLKGAKPSKHEPEPLVLADVEPGLRLSETSEGIYLEMHLPPLGDGARRRPLVTTELLGRAAVPDLPYERPDGSPIRVDTDWSGKRRDPANPSPGPFEGVGPGAVRIRLR